MNSLKQKNKRTNYKRITQQIRLQLIQRVINKKQNIKSIVNGMGINISTAKAILKVYQEEGRVGKKKKRDRIINVIKTFSFYTFDGDNVKKLTDTVIQEEKKLIQTAGSNEIQKELKEKSRQRGQQLMKQVLQKYNQAKETAEFNRSINELAAFQNQIFYQYFNQGGYQYKSMSLS